MNIKKSFLHLLLISATAFSCYTSVYADFSSNKLSALNIGGAEFISTPVVKTATLDCVVGTEDGVNVIYTTASGNPCIFNVYDMDNNILLRSFELWGAASSSAHAKSPDGKIYIAGSSDAKLFCYSPDQKALEDLGSIKGQTAAYQLAFDGKGNIFIGTYPSGAVIKYNVNDKTYTSFGESYPNHEYTRSTAYYNGYVYAGTVGSPRAYLVKINPSTGEKTPIYVPSKTNYYTEVDSVYSVTLVNKYLFVYSGTRTSDGAKGNMWIVYDCEGGVWKDIAISKAAGLYASPEKNGYTYLIADGYLKSVNLSTFAVANIAKYGTGSRQFWWANINNAKYPSYKTNTLVTINATGKPIFANITQKTVLTIEANSDTIRPGAISLQNMAAGNNGKLYLGTYLGGVCVEYDIETQTAGAFSMGQTEAIKTVGEKIYFGVYPSAELYVLDTAKPFASDNPKKLFAIGNEQSRPYIIESGGGMVFAGSVPDYSKLGGALSIYSNSTGTLNVYRNVVQDQSIVGLAYKNGRLYGSTSVSGGLGIEPTQTEAKIFVWDTAQNKKIAEFVPAWPEEVPKPVKHIGDLEVGPDGLIWGAAQGFLFAIDPETCEFVKTKMVGNCDWSGNGHFWRPVYLRFAPDGLLYTTQSGIAVIDTDTLEYIDLKSKTRYDVNLMDIGQDGNLYYTLSSSFYKINVTRSTGNSFVSIGEFGLYSDSSFTVPLSSLTAEAYAYAKAEISPWGTGAEGNIRLALASYEKTGDSSKLLSMTFSDASLPIASGYMTAVLKLPSEITESTHVKAFIWNKDILLPLSSTIINPTALLKSEF